MPLGRKGTADEAAGGVLFLASQPYPYALPPTRTRTPTPYPYPYP